MVKPFLAIATIVFILGTCITASAQSSDKQVKASSSKTNVKFLEDISIEPESINTTIAPSVKDQLLKVTPQFASLKEATSEVTTMPVEQAKGLQFKYGILLDIEVELVNLSIFKVIDQWYGVRYRLGGMSKSGIDCSALMQTFFNAIYNVALPRTAREQYNYARHISRAEIKEGDLVFFNTRGGVSHVGMYLANNKFVHASTSGVTISSLYDSYYANRLIGVGRIDAAQLAAATALLSPQP
jgi:lipoprotein Spr